MSALVTARETRNCLSTELSLRIEGEQTTASHLTVISGLSPIADFGRDYDSLLRSCMAERKGRKMWRQLSVPAAWDSSRRCDHVTPLTADSAGQEQKVTASPEASVDGESGDLNQKGHEIDVVNAPESSDQSSEASEESKADLQENEARATGTKSPDVAPHETLSIPKSSENDMLDHRPAERRRAPKDAVRLNAKSSRDSFLVAHIRNGRKASRKTEQGKKKKWKATDINAFSFEFSLLPRRTPLEEHDTTVFENDLDKFEKLCDVQDQDAVKFPDEKEIENIEASLEPAISVTTVEKRDALAVPSLDVCEDCDWFDGPCILDLENKLQAKDRAMADRFFYLGVVKRLRKKRKWRVEKTHKAVKSKHCRHVNNCPHGHKFSVNHRVLQRMSNLVMRRSNEASYSLKKIDKEKTVDRKTWRELEKSGQVNAPGRPASGARGGAAYIPRDRNQPPHHALALNAYNADDDLTADLVNLLMTMQERDLTPEDYELLLRLDERVAPKTLDSTSIAQLETTPVTEDMLNETCAICQDKYATGEETKLLPCGHYFHVACIDNWLNMSSTTCPLDGSEVSL